MMSNYFANICRDSSISAGFFLLNGLGCLSKRKKVDLTWAFKQTASNWAAGCMGSGLPRDSWAKCLTVFNSN